MAASWRGQEPAWSDDAAALGRGMRHGVRRPFLLLLLASLLTLFVVGWKAREAPYPTRVVLRISESTFNDRSDVLSRGAIRAWISDAALSRDRLYDVIERFDLYRTAQAFGRDAAVAELREDFDIEVFSNYFLISSYKAGQLRTARVALTFHDSDRKRSQQVAMALAQKVIDFETERSRQLAAQARDVADRMVQRARDALTERERRITEKLYLLEAGGENDPIAVEVEVRELAESLEASQRLLKYAQDERDELELNLAAEDRKVANRIEIANIEPPPVSHFSRAEILSGIGLATFLLSLPFCALAAGAFDGRVRDVEDLRRLDLPVFGVVPTRDRRRPK